MIISKVSLTADEKREYDELEDLIKHLMQDFRSRPYQEREQILTIYREAADKQHAIMDGAEERYINSMSTDYDGIIATVKEILDAYTRKDFKECISDSREFAKSEIKRLGAMLHDPAAADIDTEKREKLTEQLREQKDDLETNFSYTFSCVHIILEDLTTLEATALAVGRFPLDEYKSLLDKRAAELYPPKRGEKIAETRGKAIERGALMTIGGRVATYTDQDLKDALNGFSIVRLPTGTDSKSVFDTEGKLNTLALGTNKLEGMTRLHTAFFMVMVKAVHDTPSPGDNTVMLYVPAITREIGLDPRGHSRHRKEDGGDLSEQRFKRLMDIVSAFEPLAGRAPDGSYYRVMTFQEYDRQSETIKISTPYLFKLEEISRWKEQQLNKPQLNLLLHSTVFTEPNQAAVELASRILNGIEKRGQRPDPFTYKRGPKLSKKTVSKTDSKGGRTTTTLVYDTSSDTWEPEPAPTSNTVSYTVRFSSLIKECPQIAKDLEEIEASDSKTKSQAFNSKLKQVFEAAYRIIMEKSDAPAKYIDFTLPTTQKTIKGKRQICYDVPTKSTLNRNLIITYRGKNKSFTL